MLGHTLGSTNTPAVDYYATNYTTTGTATDVTGVAAAINVETGSVPPTLTAHDAAGDTFFSPGLATDSNSFFNVFVYIP